MDKIRIVFSSGHVEVIEDVTYYKITQDADGREFNEIAIFARNQRVSVKPSDVSAVVVIVKPEET